MDVTINSVIEELKSKDVVILAGYTIWWSNGLTHQSGHSDVVYTDKEDAQQEIERLREIDTQKNKINSTFTIYTLRECQVRIRK